MALTGNGVRMLRNASGTGDVKPMVQVIGMSRLESGGTERWKLEISDGVSFTSGMLATQHNQLVKEQAIREGAIIQVMESITNQVQGRQILILLDVRVVGHQPKIGNPTDLDGAAKSAAPQQQHQQQPAAAPRNVAPPQPQFNAPAPIQQQQQQQRPPFTPVQAQYNYAGGGPTGGGAGAIAAAPSSAGHHHQAPIMAMHTMGSTISPPNGVSASNINTRVIPIKALNPYQNRWTIKARVTSKTDIRSWDKGAQNQGKLFSIDLVDEEGTEIRATFFRDAVDLFYEGLQVGAVYTFADGKVKLANRQFNNAIKNEYELTFGKEALISRAEDSDRIARVNASNLAPIANVAGMEVKSLVDLVGICTYASEPSNFTSKAGKELKKLEVELLDDSMHSVRVTLWNTKADEYAAPLRQAADSHAVVLVKKAQIGEYNGTKNLSSVNSSQIVVNPDIPKAGQLRSWYDAGGPSSGTIVALSGGGGGGGGAGGGAEGGGGGRFPPVPIDSRETCETVKESPTLGQDPSRADFVEVKATVLFLKRDNPWYPACHTESCKNKKVTKNPSSEEYFCEKCGQSFPSPQYRYIGLISIADGTMSMYCSAFNESYQALLGGHSASDLQALSLTDPQAYNSVMDAAQFQTYVFKLKVRQEMYQGAARQKYEVQRATKVNFINENKELLRGIENYKRLV